MRAPAEPDHPAGPPLAHPVGFLDMLDPLLHLGWLQNFFENTSCNICLSIVKSATSRFSCRFSSSSCLRRRSSETPSPSYFFFQRKKVCSEIPIFRQTSMTRIPASTCRKAKAICFSVNFDFFIRDLLPLILTQNSHFEWNSFQR